MPRLPEVRDLDVAPEDRELLNASVFRILFHNPSTARAFNSFTRHFRNAALDPKLLELALIQVGYVGRSLYVYGRHLRLGLDAGLSEAEIAAVAKETRGGSSDLSPLQKAVLRAARELAIGQEISKTTFNELRAGLSVAALIDLIVAASWYVGVVRLMNTLEMEIEDGYKPLLERFPLS